MKSIVFVITPFAEDFLDLFEELSKHFQEKYTFTNAGDMDNQRSIIKDIVVGINSADIVIADLTGNNPNVFYELGLAHAMNKKVIIITQSIDDLPFDIKTYRALQYSLKFNKIPEFEEKLGKYLDGAIDGSVAYGNPVNDYLPDFFKRCENEEIIVGNPSEGISNPEKSEIEQDNSGMIDYIATINDKYIVINNEVEAICSDVNDVNESIEKATSDINRVKIQSGNVDISYYKKACKRLGDPIRVFSDSFIKHTNNISNEWNDIENSFLLLLDNKLFLEYQGQESVIKHKNSLIELKDVMKNSGAQMISFSNEIHQFQGFERTLNKSIVLLEYSLENYIQMTNLIDASIDRIIGKIDITLGL